MNLEDLLDAGLAELALPISEGARARLLAYVRLLEKWNQTYNLTAVREPAAMVTQHLLDTLATLPHLPGGTLADIGSGGGIPGVPIAIAQSERPVTLVESNQKKVAFLRQVAIELALPNVEVVEGRVESLAGREFDVLISRALSELPEFARMAGHLLAPGGSIVSMKGLYPHEELASLQQPWQVRDVVPLRVPGLDAARHLVLAEAAA
ncbi:MAG: 16S rRNA (guanine(527)-N(7))-methyltransferase RsmG [Rhodocyclaceae bacterium]|nr:16S rRNA (guanine(527)-N(7))-methyltransferase RsmG [Rhodocyclaceae bacterium]